MSTDPDDLGQGPGDRSGGAGTPTPEQLENERLKQENADLRKANREERATALGATHGLTPTQIELLKLVPKDQMEEKAIALASERQGPPSPAPAPADGDGQPPPPADGAPPADPSLQAFDGAPAGQPVGDPSLSWQAELHERLNEAETLEEVADIQREFRERQRSGQLG